MDRLITIDAAGRLVIPKDVRRRYHLRRGSQLRLREDGVRLLLEPVLDECPLEDRGSLLIVTAALEGDVPDHRGFRDERLAMLDG